VRLFSPLLPCDFCLLSSDLCLPFPDFCLPLFERERSVISKHINNIFKKGELVQDSVCANFAHTAEDGKTYQTRYYNLDVIISVGYRAPLNSILHGLDMIF